MRDRGRVAEQARERKTRTREDLGRSNKEKTRKRGRGASGANRKLKRGEEKRSKGEILLKFWWIPVIFVRIPIKDSIPKAAKQVTLNLFLVHFNSFYDLGLFS